MSPHLNLKERPCTGLYIYYIPYTYMAASLDALGGNDQEHGEIESPWRIELGIGSARLPQEARKILKLRVVPFDLRTASSQNCEAVPRKARI